MIPTVWVWDNHQFWVFSQVMRAGLAGRLGNKLVWLLVGGGQTIKAETIKRN